MNVLWLQSGGCGGCSMSLLCADTTDFQGHLRDAGIDLQTPFAVSTVLPAPVAGFTTHALAPEALLQVYRDLERAEPPPCTLLAIRAQRFELGEAPGEQALADLALALAWATEWAQLPEEMLT
jgi:hypothetical protein